MSTPPKLNARILADMAGRPALSARQRLRAWLPSVLFALLMAAAVAVAVAMGFDHLTVTDLIGRWLAAH